MAIDRGFAVVVSGIKDKLRAIDFFAEFGSVL